MAQPLAELVASREFLPGHWQQLYRAPWVAAGAQPGQYLQVCAPDPALSVMRRPLSIDAGDRANGTVEVTFRAADGATRWLAGLRPPTHVELQGPLGRPFEMDSRARHVLLVAAGPAISAVRAVAIEAVAANRQVTLLFGAPSAAQVYPSSLLPEEVEYVVATDDGSFGHHGPVTELVPSFEAWADQAFASGPYALLAALAAQARGRQARLGVAPLGARPGRGTRARPKTGRQALRRAWLQVALEQEMVCAGGTCLGCVVTGADRPQRTCREGPVFASDEIAWQAPG